MGWPWQSKIGDTPGAVLREVALAIAQATGSSAGAPPIPVQPTAFLGADLGLSSIAVARLAGILQKRFGGIPLPFHTLLVKPGGVLLYDIRVLDLVLFLERHIHVDAP